MSYQNETGTGLLLASLAVAIILAIAVLYSGSPANATERDTTSNAMDAGAVQFDPAKALENWPGE